MSLENVQKKIDNSTGQDTVNINKSELDKALSESYQNGKAEQERFKGVSNTGVANWEEDPFYDFYANEGVTQGVFNKDDLKGKRKKVLESMTGISITEGSGGSVYGVNKYLTQDALFMIQSAAYVRSLTDPLAVSIAKNNTNFVIGKGVEIDCIIPEIEIEINKVRKNNKMERLDRQCVNHTMITGEFFYKIKEKRNGFYIYGVAPSNVIEIEHDIENLDCTVAYKVIPPAQWTNTAGVFGFDEATGKWYPSITYDEKEVMIPSKNKGKFVSREYIQYIKYGNYDELRGNPPFRSVLKALRYAEDYTVDRMRLNHERSKVIMVKRVSNNAASITQKPQQLPRGGMTLIETDDIRYDFLESHIDGQDAKEDGMWILHTIGAGVLMPPHILQQRSDQAVYASIKKAETPFSQNIVAWQDFFEENWSDTYRFIIKRLIEKRRLKRKYKVPAFVGLASTNSSEAKKAFQEINLKINEMLFNHSPMEEIEEAVSKVLKNNKLDKTISVPTEDIPINMIFPDVVNDNQLDMAKVLFLHRKMGLVSLATSARKAGYDWKNELFFKVQEKEIEEEFGLTLDNDKTPNSTGFNKQDGDPKINDSK